MIRLSFFAQLAESPNRRETTAAAAATPAALVAAHPHWGLNPAVVRVVVNGRWAQWSTPLSDGDDVAFLPPSNAF